MPETEEVVCNNCPPGVTGKANKMFFSFFLTDAVDLCFHSGGFLESYNHFRLMHTF